MSWAVLMAGFEAERDAAGRLSPTMKIFRARILNVLEYYNRMRATVPVSLQIVKLYSEHLTGHMYFEGEEGGRLIPVEERLVIATSIVGVNGEPTILVDQRQSVYDELASTLNLQLEDPYA